MRLAAFTICLGLLTAATSVAALAETQRPKPRPEVSARPANLTAQTVTPRDRAGAGGDIALLLVTASSFVSAAGIVTGTPLFALPK